MPREQPGDAESRCATFLACTTSRSTPDAISTGVKPVATQFRTPNDDSPTPLESGANRTTLSMCCRGGESCSCCDSRRWKTQTQSRCKRDVRWGYSGKRRKPRAVPVRGGRAEVPGSARARGAADSVPWTGRRTPRPRHASNATRRGERHPRPASSHSRQGPT
eukprot:scaffold203_cov386-Prasinococcus_capsulatus_cf.AAC.10